MQTIETKGAGVSFGLISAAAIFFAWLSATQFVFPLAAFALSPLGISWDSGFFLPQVAFPNDYINKDVAAENHIPLVTTFIGWWLALRLPVWQAVERYGICFCWPRQSSTSVDTHSGTDYNYSEFKFS